MKFLLKHTSVFQWCPRHYSPDMNESSWTLLSVSCDFPPTHPLPPAFHHYLFLLTIRFLHPILPSSFFPASPLRCNLNRGRIFPLLESDASNMLRPLLVIRGVIGKKPLGLDIQLGARGLHGCSGLSLACKTWPSSAWTTLFRSSGRWPCRCVTSTSNSENDRGMARALNCLNRLWQVTCIF